MTIRQTAEERRLFWLKLSHNWKMTHWVVGILGVIFSTLAAATNVSKDTAPYFSIGAAMCIGFVGFANPQKQAYVKLSAYRILDNAILEHELTKDDAKLKTEIERSETVANPES